MHAALAPPGPSPPSDLDLAVAELRAGRGWPAAARAVSAARVLAGGKTISVRSLRRLVRDAGRLEAFPLNAGNAGKGRTRKPALTEEECKLARTVRDGKGTWEDAARAINASRPAADRISDRTLRDRLKGASS